MTVVGGWPGSVIVTLPSKEVSTLPKGSSAATTTVNACPATMGSGRRGREDQLRGRRRRHGDRRAARYCAADRVGRGDRLVPRRLQHHIREGVRTGVQRGERVRRRKADSLAVAAGQIDHTLVLVGAAADAIVVLVVRRDGNRPGGAGDVGAGEAGGHHQLVAAAGTTASCWVGAEPRAGSEAVTVGVPAWVSP